MKKIVHTTRLPTMREITTVNYEAIDGMVFLHESNCASHERSCLDWQVTYLKLNQLVPRAYSLKEMQKKLSELEDTRQEWEKASLKDWCDYNANVYGLKTAIKVISQRGD